MTQAVPGRIPRNTNDCAHGTLAAVETVAVVLIAFGTQGWWLLILSGTAALGVIYTGFGSGVGARYASVNEMLLPASVFVAVLLLPLLPHFGLGPRVPILVHPIEPALTLIRAGYGSGNAGDIACGTFGSVKTLATRSSSPHSVIRHGSAEMPLDVVGQARDRSLGKPRT